MIKLIWGSALLYNYKLLPPPAFNLFAALHTAPAQKGFSAKRRSPSSVIHPSAKSLRNF
ncbi:MAG: hypothetical protein K2X48_08790 [Chitinophagaceae bacterium]|nr:hypothetical protein [Chitinophagaceae bacterium]